MADDQYETKLSGAEEQEFQQWKKKYAPNDAGTDYDLRGAFKAGLKPDAERGHFPDTFKKPNHPTFSAESQYSKGEQTGGKWTEKDGKVSFEPSDWNLKTHSPEKLRDYFKKTEPDAELVLPTKAKSMADDASDPSDRAAMLAEAYKRGILPADVKAQYEEAMKRGLVAKADEKKEPSAYGKYTAEQLKSFSPEKRELIRRTHTDEPEAPKWDVLGDIGRTAKGAVATMGQAFPSPGELKTQEAANNSKYGPVLGEAKSAMLDPLASSAKLPLGALALVGSPITGALHALAGSALGSLPGMNKQLGDEAVDQGMMGLPPGRTGGGIVATADRATAATQAANAAKAAEVATQNAAAIAKNPKLAQARAAGYVVHPADAVEHPGVIADAASGLGGKIKTQQEASVRNQKITNSIAAKELGLPADTTLDEATFNSVRGKAANSYKNIENSTQKLPNGKLQTDVDFRQAVTDLDDIDADLRREFPELTKNKEIEELQDSLLKPEFSPKSAIGVIRVLRNKATANMKAWDKPDQVALGRAQRAAAGAVEDLIDRQLTATGDATAVAEYRAARQTIAKSHDIELATDERGNVDARKLASLGGKRPFTGGLKTIADTAGSFPKSMQNPTKFGGAEKRSILDTMTALGSGGAALWAHNPYLAIPGIAAMVGRPAARSLALSDFLQNRLLGLRSTQQSGIRQGALPAIAGQNALRQMLPQQGSPMPQQQPQPGQQ